ncbi:MAG: Flp family type IVb pilin [Alphaproteobacteria bacterium]
MHESGLSTVWDRAFLRLFAGLGSLRRDKRGVTAIEYGLIAAGIAAVIVVAVLTLSDEVGEMFTTTSDAVDDAIGG